MAKKENIKPATEEKYRIRSIYDNSGEDFETVLKKVILSTYSCIKNKNDIKYL